MSIPTVNYPSLSKSQAQRVWRQRCEILRYSQAAHTDTLESLLLRMDELDDETLFRYLRERPHRLRARKGGAAGTIGMGPMRDSRDMVGSIANPKTMPSAGSIDQRHYSRIAGSLMSESEISERAFKIGKAKAMNGESVDYAQVREAVRAGRL